MMSSYFLDFCSHRNRFFQIAIFVIGIASLNGAAVTLTASDPQVSPSFNAAGNWSNAAAPSAGNTYSTGAFVLRSSNFGGSVTFAGDSLTVSSGGQLILKNNDGETTTVGNLILNGGNIGQGNIGFTLTLAGAITVGAESGIDLFQNDNRKLIITAPISGASNLVVGESQVGGATSSTVVLSGNNSAFSGGFTLGSGGLPPTSAIIQVNHVNALGTGPLSLTGGTVDLNGFSTTVGNFTGTGGTVVNQNSGTTATLTIGGSNGTGGNFQGVVANNTSGTGVVAITKTGTGTITLTGTNTATGLLTLNNGTVVVGTEAGGSWAGSVLANSGSRLGGRGTIGGDVTIASGATYGPGNSPGIQSVLGNLTLASGSRTEIEIDGANPGNGAGFHDQINVTGTVTIQGGTIAPMTVFSGSSGYTPSAGQRFAAITGSSVTGQFTTIDNSANPTGLTFIPEYTSNTVFLRTTLSDFSNNPLLTLSGNELSLSRSLNQFRPPTIVTGAGASDADRIYDALTKLNVSGVKSAIAQMNPETLQEAPKLSQSISKGVHSQVTRQVELRRDINPAHGELSIYDRNGQTVYEPVASSEVGGFLFQRRRVDKLSFFASVQGEQGEVKPSQTRTDFEYWSAAAIYGGNYALSSDWNLGLFAGYGHSDTSVGGTGGKIGYNGGSFGGYVGWNHADWFLQLSSSVGKGFYDTRRNLSFLSEQARGETEGWESTTELRGGKDLSFGKWTLSPSVYGRYSRTFLDAYDETGSAARLHIGATDQQSAVSGAGVALQRLFPIGKMSLAPRLFANYEREWIRSGTINARFAAGGDSFRIQTDPIDPDQLTAGAGLSWFVSERLQWDLAYERETLQNDLKRQAVNLSCKFSF